MGILKYEMRAMFEKKYNQTILGPQSLLDDGVLRLIAYLSFLNPYVFPELDFKVLCVKSSAAKRKIYSCSMPEQDIAECAAALIFFNDESNKNSEIENKLNLLEISIMYSCLINQVDYEVIKVDNPQVIKDYFNLPDNSIIHAIITLGYFKNIVLNTNKLIKYDEAVKEV
jgi:hypothetical protein